MNILVGITGIAFALWTLRNIAFWVGLWQLKEYRFDRVSIHLKETSQGKHLLFSPIHLIKWAFILGYFSTMWQSSLINVYSLLIGALFVIEAETVILEIMQHRLKRPKLTGKSILIAGLTILPISILFFVPLIHWFVWLLLLDRLVPLIVAFWVYIFSFPTELYRDLQIDKATKKLAQYPDIIVIGITGSYGKSSTKEYIAQILAHKFKLVKTQGTNNTPIGIAATILQKIDETTEMFVVEMGAYKRGEIAEMTQIVHPTIGVLTAVSGQHLSLFGSIENTMKAKYELIASLPDDGVAIFNGTNERALSLFRQTKKKKVLYFRKDGHGKVPKDTTIVVEDIHTSPSGTLFTIKIENKKFSFTTPLIGAHNIEDILPGIYLAKHFGMPNSEIQKAVASLVPLPKTMVRKTLKNGVVVIDDTFNANPDAVTAAVDYIRTYKGKKIMVMQPMIELGDSVLPEHTRVASSIGHVCDELILTNKNFTKAIEQGLEKTPQCHLRYGSVEEVATYLRDNTTKGDVIIFEGKEAGFILDRLTQIS